MGVEDIGGDGEDMWRYRAYVAMEPLVQTPGHIPYPALKPQPPRPMLRTPAPCTKYERTGRARVRVRVRIKVSGGVTVWVRRCLANG